MQHAQSAADDMSNAKDALLTSNRIYESLDGVDIATALVVLGRTAGRVIADLPKDVRDSAIAGFGSVTGRHYAKFAAQNDEALAQLHSVIGQTDAAPAEDGAVEETDDATARAADVGPVPFMSMDLGSGPDQTGAMFVLTDEGREALAKGPTTKTVEELIDELYAEGEMVADEILDSYSAPHAAFLIGETVAHIVMQFPLAARQATFDLIGHRAAKAIDEMTENEVQG